MVFIYCTLTVNVTVIVSISLTLSAVALRHPIPDVLNQLTTSSSSTLQTFMVTRVSVTLEVRFRRGTLVLRTPACRERVPLVSEALELREEKERIMHLM